MSRNLLPILLHALPCGSRIQLNYLAYLFALLYMFNFGNGYAQNDGITGTWSGTWSYSGPAVQGNCRVNQGGEIVVELQRTGDGRLSGTGWMTGIACYDVFSCRFLNSVPSSITSIEGTITGSTIEIQISGFLAGAPCFGIPSYASYVGFIGDNRIEIHNSSAVFESQLSLTRDNTGFQKSNGPASNPGSICCGDPIDLGTGNMDEQVADFHTPGGSLSFSRYYNSLAGSDTLATSFGGHWRSIYDCFLRIVYANGTPAIVTAETADGKELRFSFNGTRWVSDSDVDLTLTRDGNLWILRDRNDDEELYQTVGSVAYLIRTQTRSNYRQDITYEGTRPVAVTDSFGRSLQFGYQGNLLRTVTAPGGLVITYGYDSSGQSPGVLDRLVSVTYSTSPQTGKTYRYENPAFPFALTSVTDENGAEFTRWTYDAQGRATSSQLAGGVSRLAIGYNGTDGSRMVTNALGLVEHYAFTGLQGVPKVTEQTRITPALPAASNPRFVYDDNGYQSARRDWNGNVSAFVNDSRGLPTYLVEGYERPEGRTNQVSYHATYRLPLRLVEARRTMDFTYDTEGNLRIQKETDTTTHTVPYSTRGQTRSFAFTYNSLGQVLTAVGPRTDVAPVTLYGYDASGNLRAVTNALGQVTRFTRYNGRGQPLELVDANGVTNRFTYHLRGWLLKREVLAASGNAVTEFTYDPAGQLTATRLPDGSTRRNFYDAAHRLRSVTNSLGESIYYTLDAAGNVTRQDIRDAQGRITQTRRREFDALGRLLRDIGAAGQSTGYGYDGNGNPVRMTDGLNRATTNSFDALDRMVASLDPLNHTLREGYDSQDNLVSVTDPRSLTTGYVYDGFGQLIQESSPDRGTMRYALDAAGNRVAERDGRNVLTTRTFDALDRVLTESFPDAPAENITYSYDATGGGNRGVGRLTGFTDETGSTTLRHDERGNLVSTTRTIGGRAYTSGYAYDLADRVTRITYPSGHVVTYGRDGEGRINAVNFRPSAAATPVPLASGVTYLPFGPVSGFTYGNGLTRTHGFDLDYRLTRITTEGVQDLGLAYNAVNNITAITNRLDAGRSQWFGYDANSRLTNAVGSYGTLGYAYDGVGNRLLEVSNGVTNRYRYPANANRLEAVERPEGTRSFAYTEAGNITSDNRGAEGVYGYQYGARNRLKTLTRNGSTVATYAYNALGQRLVKTVGGTVTHYHYDQQSHLIAETDGQTGVLLREYVWLGDMPLAVIEGDGTVYFIHCDHLHTPQKLTDESGAIVWDREQKPFGETVAITAGSAPRLTGGGFNGLGQFQVTVSGTAGTSYVVQRATSLNGGSWLPVATNTAPFTFTDSTSQATQTRFYRVVASASANSTSVTLNLRFPGQYFDAESGLHYNLMRDYDSLLGRYIESDVIGLNGGINIYEYALDNPISSIDPFGLDWVIVRYPGSADNPAGHAGIGVAIPNSTSQTIGFYPVDSASTWIVATGAGVPGIVKYDTKYPTRAEEIVVQTTALQDLLIASYLKSAITANQTYRLYMNNCANMVSDALRAGGIKMPNNSLPLTPENLVEQLKKIQPYTPIPVRSPIVLPRPPAITQIP